MENVRQPSQEELQELAHIVYENVLDEEETWQLIERAYIAVFDNYMSDTPGYCGKVMVVVWPGGPELFEVFVWRDNQLQSIQSEISQ